MQDNKANASDQSFDTNQTSSPSPSIKASASKTKGKVKQKKTNKGILDTIKKESETLETQQNEDPSAFNDTYSNKIDNDTNPNQEHDHAQDRAPDLWEEEPIPTNIFDKTDDSLTAKSTEDTSGEKKNTQGKSEAKGKTGKKEASKLKGKKTKINSEISKEESSDFVNITQNKAEANVMAIAIANTNESGQEATTNISNDQKNTEEPTETPHSTPEQPNVIIRPKNPKSKEKQAKKRVASSNENNENNEKKKLNTTSKTKSNKGLNVKGVKGIKKTKPLSTVKLKGQNQKKDGIISPPATEEGTKPTPNNEITETKNNVEVSKKAIKIPSVKFQGLSSESIKRIGVVLAMIGSLVGGYIYGIPKLKELYNWTMGIEENQNKELILEKKPPKVEEGKKILDQSFNNQDSTNPNAETYNDQKHEIAMEVVDRNKVEIKKLPLEDEKLGKNIDKNLTQIIEDKTPWPRQENKFVVVETEIQSVVKSTINPQKRYIKILDPNLTEKSVVAETSTEALTKLIDSGHITKGSNARITLSATPNKLRAKYEEERLKVSQVLGTKEEDFFTIEEYEIKKDKNDL